MTKAKATVPPAPPAKKTLEIQINTLIDKLSTLIGYPGTEEQSEMALEEISELSSQNWMNLEPEPEPELPPPEIRSRKKKTKQKKIFKKKKNKKKTKRRKKK